jgi:hypothetical protein
MVKKGYSHTSIPRMGRMACTELQCLYKGELYYLTFFIACGIRRVVDSVMAVS